MIQCRIIEISIRNKGRVNQIVRSICKDNSNIMIFPNMYMIHSSRKNILMPTRKTLSRNSSFKQLRC